MASSPKIILLLLILGILCSSSSCLVPKPPGAPIKHHGVKNHHKNSTFSTPNNKTSTFSTPPKADNKTFTVNQNNEAITVSLDSTGKVEVNSKWKGWMVVVGFVFGGPTTGAVLKWWCSKKVEEESDTNSSIDDVEAPTLPISLKLTCCNSISIRIDCRDGDPPPKT